MRPVGLTIVYRHPVSLSACSAKREREREEHRDTERHNESDRERDIEKDYLVSEECEIKRSKVETKNENKNSSIK